MFEVKFCKNPLKRGKKVGNIKLKIERNESIAYEIHWCIMLFVVLVNHS